MNHLYLLTLEIEPLEIGRVYGELPSHLTLMSRFLSDLDPKELNDIIRPVIESAGNITLSFGPTIELGPKKVIAHMADSPDERLPRTTPGNIRRSKCHISISSIYRIKSQGTCDTTEWKRFSSGKASDLINRVSYRGCRWAKDTTSEG